MDEDGDAFNDDTFGSGGSSAPVGKDFDFFGKTAQMVNALDEEQGLYHLKRGRQGPAKPATAKPWPGDSVSTRSIESTEKPKKTGYEQYQDPGYIPEIQVKSNVWETSSKTKPEQSAPPRKVLSLEEVEAQLQADSIRAQSQQQQNSQHPISSSFPIGFIQPPPLVNIPQYDIPRLPDGHPFSIPDFPSLNMPTPFIPPLNPPPNLPLQGLPPPSQMPSMASMMIQPLEHPTQGLSISPLRDPGIQPPTAPRKMQSHPKIGKPSSTSLNFAHLTEDQRHELLLEDAKRARRNHKIFLLSRGNGLMTPQDKNFITRIQLQQLVSASGNVSDPDAETMLAEDFYYQVYSQIRGAPRQHPRQPLGQFAQTYLFQSDGRSGSGGRKNLGGDNHMQRMQQQVQRAVEAAKMRPKNKQLMIEGSLGKISVGNAKTPRTMLNIKRPGTDDSQKASHSRKNLFGVSDRKSVLRIIETAYVILMQMEDHERMMPPPPPEDDAEAVERHLEWRKVMQGLNKKLWDSLKVMEPIIPGSQETHPFIAFLSYPKGKKAIPRIFRHIDQEQRVTVLTMITVHLDSLDVVQRAVLHHSETQPPPAIREEIELFQHAVMPSLLSYVNDAPINIITGLVGLILAQTHIQTIAKTRIGLSILTMLISRAEIVKEAGTADMQESRAWDDLYDTIFDRLEPVLSDIFPGGVNNGDDMYVWQFLAALGIGANPEQQQRLVIAVK